MTKSHNTIDPETTVKVVATKGDKSHTQYMAHKEFLEIEKVSGWTYRAYQNDK